MASERFPSPKSFVPASFQFATGYGAPGLEGGFRGQANLTKPFTQSELESALREILR
jgi:hypothetical protein